MSGRRELHNVAERDDEPVARVESTQGARIRLEDRRRRRWCRRARRTEDGRLDLFRINRGTARVLHSDLIAVEARRTVEVVVSPEDAASERKRRDRQPERAVDRDAAMSWGPLNVVLAESIRRRGCEEHAHIVVRGAAVEASHLYLNVGGRGYSGRNRVHDGVLKVALRMDLRAIRADHQVAVETVGPNRRARWNFDVVRERREVSGRDRDLGMRCVGCRREPGAWIPRGFLWSDVAGDLVVSAGCQIDLSRRADNPGDGADIREKDGESPRIAGLEVAKKSRLELILRVVSGCRLCRSHDDAELRHQNRERNR